MLELNKLGTKVKRLEINWIKAHIGYKGNEKADQLARDAEHKEEIELYIAESWTHMKSTLWTNIYKTWENRWIAEQRFRLTKMFYPHPSKTRSKNIMKLNRPQMTLWAEIITGQNNLNYVQSKIYNNIDPTCRFCEEEEETIPHILMECPCFMSLRNDILLGPYTPLNEWTQSQILNFCKNNSIKFALSFETRLALA